jgi:hypothetical protein
MASSWNCESQSSILRFPQVLSIPEIKEALEKYEAERKKKEG